MNGSLHDNGNESEVLVVSSRNPTWTIQLGERTLPLTDIKYLFSDIVTVK